MMTEVERANLKAQEAFHACLVAYTETGSWDNPTTDAYLNAERDADWEEAKAAFDAIQTADHDYHLHIGQVDHDCEGCQEMSAESWSNHLAAY